MSEQIHSSERESRISSSREVVDVLNAALANEVSSIGRCKRSYYLAEDPNDAVRQEFLEQAVQESMHTDRIVERIIQLGGSPDFSARQEAPVHADSTVDTLDLVRAEVDAQRLNIEAYREMIGVIGAADAATCRVLEDIISWDVRFMERLNRHL